MLALFLSLLFLPLSHAQDFAWRADFETYIEKVMREQNMPGIAIQVVDENGPILQITKGYRDLEKKLPVTPHTLYAIGSTSKAFTGVILASLRDKGLINFDRPVQNYRPDFAIQDSEVSRILTLRDLMSHWTGVGRHDLGWYHRDASREEMFATIPYLDISAPPRTKFIYNNWMWVAAGVIAETVAHATWENLLQEKILHPLGMTETNASLAATQAFPDHALPYEGSTLIPFYDIHAANPAGGIYSNLNDMAKWLQFHLQGGKFNGQQVVSLASLQETYKPYSQMGEASYGMGWEITDKLLGETVLTHDGGIDGFTANVSWMPGRKLGVVVLMNDAGIAPQWIASRLWFHLLDLPLRDFVQEGKDAEAKETEENKKLYPDLNPAPAKFPLSQFTGNFCHKAYGRTKVYLDNESQSLVIKLNIIEAAITAAGGLRFFIQGVPSQIKYLNFQADEEGNVQSLDWSIEDSSNKPIKFSRCN